MTANAVSSLGMFNYSQMGYDPYFLQAFNSPNVNQMYQSQQVPAQQTAQQVSQALAGNPSFQGAQTTTEKKGNGKAWLLIGGAAALAGAAWMISRGKAAGAEGLVEQFKAGIKSFGKESAKKVVGFTEINGKKICNIPGKENIIKNSATAADDLAKIGIENGTKFSLSDLITKSDDGVQALAEGVKINKGTFNFNGATLGFEDGKIVSYVDSKGKDILSRYLSPEEVAKFADKNNADKKLIDELLAKILKGENLKDVSKMEVEHKLADVTRIFTRENPTDKFVFQQATAKRFSIDSSEVKAFMEENPAIKEALTKFKNGETVGTILRAERSTDVGTFFVENGKIEKIKTKDGKIFNFDSDEFKALHEKNATLFNEVLEEKDKLTNVIRTISF